MLLVFGAVSGSFFTGATWGSILSNAAETCLVALGLTTILMSGGFDLSVGASSQLATAIMAYLLVNGHALVVAIVVAIAVGVLSGAASGAVTLGLRVPPFVGTLAVSFVLIGAAYEVTHQQQITLNETGLLYAIGHGTIGGIPIDFGLAVVVAVLAFAGMRTRRFGFRLQASGLGQEGAFLRGIHVGRAKFGAFLIGGGVVGLSGVVAAAYSSGASGSDNSFAILLEALAACFIGQAISRRRHFNLWGSLAGAVFLSAVATGLIDAGVSSNLFPVAEGVVVLLAVAMGSAGRHGIGQDAVV